MMLFRPKKIDYPEADPLGYKLSLPLAYQQTSANLIVSDPKGQRIKAIIYRPAIKLI